MGRTIAFSVTSALAAALAAAPAAAQSLEQSVKAAFLPKFARYVTWPPAARPGAGQPFVLCVIGSDPFGAALDRAVAGQQLDQSAFVVRRMSSAAGADGCQVAFVHGASSRATAQMLNEIGRAPVLTITDSRYGSAHGIIHFAISQGRVSFHIDDAMAARSNLSISSRLLGVAMSVRQRS